MFDLGVYAEQVAKLPAEVGALCRFVQGVLIHQGWFVDYGVTAQDFGSFSRVTLPVADRLAQVFAHNADWSKPRPPRERAPVTCRDFALLLCALLRAKQIKARLRCGFGRYFEPTWEDHWVCEYFDAGAGRWRFADAQIDDVLKAKHGIGFDGADVPRSRYWPAGRAWLAARAGRLAFEDFGQGPVRGAWFLHVDVVRDALAMRDVVTSGWDRWRTVTEEERRLSEGELLKIDALARRPRTRRAQSLAFMDAIAPASLSQSLRRLRQILGVPRSAGSRAHPSRVRLRRCRSQRRASPARTRSS